MLAYVKPQMEAERLRAGETTPLETAVLVVSVGRTELLREGWRCGRMPTTDAVAMYGVCVAAVFDPALNDGDDDEAVAAVTLVTRRAGRGRGSSTDQARRSSSATGAAVDEDCGGGSSCGERGGGAEVDGRTCLSRSRCGRRVVVEQLVASDPRLEACPEQAEPAGPVVETKPEPGGSVARPDGWPCDWDSSNCGCGCVWIGVSAVMLMLLLVPRPPTARRPCALVDGCGPGVCVPRYNICFLVLGVGGRGATTEQDGSSNARPQTTLCSAFADEEDVMYSVRSTV